MTLYPTARPRNERKTLYLHACPRCNGAVYLYDAPDGFLEHYCLNCGACVPISPSNRDKLLRDPLRHV